MILFLLGDTYPQRFLYNCTSEDVKHSLRFLGFFPCSPDSNRDLNQCDILTLSAVELAINKINQDPNILSCFKLELLPVFTNDPIQVSRVCVFTDNTFLVNLVSQSIREYFLWHGYMLFFIYNESYIRHAYLNVSV